MILVDTSIWIDHLHRSEPALVHLLELGDVATHPMVIGELALGSLRDRATVLSLLDALPQTAVATHSEVRAFVEARELHGIGLNLVDVHLLAGAMLTAGTLLWTRDRRLGGAATSLGLAADQP